jgi:hypothetical protein
MQPLSSDIICCKLQISLFFCILDAYYAAGYKFLLNDAYTVNCLKYIAKKMTELPGKCCKLVLPIKHLKKTAVFLTTRFESVH